jgi:diguanylate cyclase (GGDEF)-like protein/PAS domain S-box-containing protein
MKRPEHKLAEPGSTAGRHECVLLIAADADEAARVLGELGSVTEERFQVEWVTTLSRGIERLREGGVGAAVLDLALLDLNLPRSQNAEILDQLFQAAPSVPILILSEADTEAAAREGVQRGAQDYLLKEQADGYRLRRAVHTMMDRHAAEAVALENEVANATLDSIGEAVLRTDIHGSLTYLNRVAENMTGWFREEALGRPIEDVLRLVDSVSGTAVDNAVATVIHGDRTIAAMMSSISCTLVRRDGVELGIENRVTVVDDRAGHRIGAVLVIRDVGAARAASLETSRASQHDVLTNLPNRTLFNDRLRQAISLAERQGNQLAVLFVDLDRFKRINDSLGHTMGDKLLRSVAGRLVACVRRTDTVCRMGGDEFVILLSQVENAEDAAITARKVLRAVAAPHIIDNKALDVNVSIGGSTYPGAGQDAESLLSQADAAMYEAKQHGRNRYEFFRSDMRVRLATRLLLERDLRYALGRNEFLLHYQPKINLKTGLITGMEALIRWVHPQRGTLLPAAFIPIAEECGLILPIGQWVLLEACRQSRAWRDAGLGVMPVAVNVSAVEFQGKDFLSGVRAVLIATGMEPQNLELELTESVLMQDPESAVVTLLALKAMGVRMAIDDFGTGYSSFTYLRRFPVDTIKVDQSFVQEITADLEGNTMVDAMINIGNSLNHRVIAEGVETHSQLDFLQRHACAEAQGYYFSHPVVAEEAGSLFKSNLQKGLVH